MSADGTRHNHPPHHLVILFGPVGGLSDVGRHAVLAALEQSRDVIAAITVITTATPINTSTSTTTQPSPPEWWDEPNWHCGCPESHAMTADDKARLTVFHVASFEPVTLAAHDPTPSSDSVAPTVELLHQHLASATTILSCLGHRQPFLTYGCVSSAGNRMILQSLAQSRSHTVTLNSPTPSLPRVLILSSMGINEDWPPLQGFWLGYCLMSLLLLTCSRPAYHDLAETEQMYHRAAAASGTVPGLSYAIIRPMGLGEDVVPVHRWATQSPVRDGRRLPMQGGKISLELAKLDAGRYLVHEALTPTLASSETVYVGGAIPSPSVPSSPK